MIGTIRATGTYPLVVVAAKAIVVNGVVDVSAQGGTSGAGWPAPNGTCPARHGSPGAGRRRCRWCRR